MKHSFYLPNPGDVGTESLWQWYNNIIKELECGFLSEIEISYLRKYYREAGLLKSWRRNFFKYHYARTFARASEFLLKDVEKPLILDLGCGTGTQSIFLAIMGARVIGLDLDTTALSIFKKRANFYEELAGHSLNISIECADAFTFDYGSHAPIDALFSLFAFNMMQPSEKLLVSLAPHLSRQARIAVLDNNMLCWFPRIYPPRRRKVWSPYDFQKALEEKGYVIRSHEGGISVSPLIWNNPLVTVTEKLDSALNKKWIFPVSHLIIAERHNASRE